MKFKEYLIILYKKYKKIMRFFFIFSFVSDFFDLSFFDSFYDENKKVNQKNFFFSYIWPLRHFLYLCIAYKMSEKIFLDNNNFFSTINVLYFIDILDTIVIENNMENENKLDEVENLPVPEKEN